MSGANFFIGNDNKAVCVLFTVVWGICFMKEFSGGRKDPTLDTGIQEYEKK